MTNIILVDKDQYQGAEVAALLNAELENVKEELAEEINEMSDLNLVGFLVYVAMQKTDDYFIQDLISRYCHHLYEKQIVAFLRS